MIRGLETNVVAFCSGESLPHRPDLCPSAPEIRQTTHCAGVYQVTVSRLWLWVNRRDSGMSVSPCRTHACRAMGRRSQWHTLEPAAPVTRSKKTKASQHGQPSEMRRSRAEGGFYAGSGQCTKCSPRSTV